MLLREWRYIRLIAPGDNELVSEAGPWQTRGTLFLGPIWAGASKEKAQGHRRNRHKCDPFEATSQDSSTSALGLCVGGGGDSRSFASFAEMKETFGLGR